MCCLTFDVVVEIGDAVETFLAQVDKDGCDLVLISKCGHRKASEAFVVDRCLGCGLSAEGEQRSGS